MSNFACRGDYAQMQRQDHYDGYGKLASLPTNWQRRFFHRHPSLFPTSREAAHGDLGLVSKHDVMITFQQRQDSVKYVRRSRAKKLNDMTSSPLLAPRFH
jgi:hypothetical protein